MEDAMNARITSFVNRNAVIADLRAGKLPGPWAPLVDRFNALPAQRRTDVATTVLFRTLMLLRRLQRLTDTVSCREDRWDRIVAQSAVERERLDAATCLLERAGMTANAAVIRRTLEDVDELGCEIVTITPRLDELANVREMTGVPTQERWCWWGRLVP